jgi:uncharacterized protein YdaU (DUF1376 family)
MKDGHRRRLMSKIHTIPLHIGDLITDTMHLSPSELGAYIRLLSVHYRIGHEGLPNDESQLRRITGLDNKSWGKSKEVIFAFFDLNEHSRWVHGKVQKVLSGIQSVQEQNRVKALKRWNTANAMAMPEQCSSSATAMQSINHKPKAKLSNKITPTPLPDWLPLQMWESYLEMRKEKDAPPTENAKKLIIGKLERWRAKGHDPSLILEKSITSNWTDIFEPKGNDDANYRNGNGRSGENGIQAGTAQIAGGVGQPPSKWQVAADRVLGKIERGEI